MCRVRKIICKTDICRPKSSCPEEEEEEQQQQQQHQEQQQVILALLEPAFRNSVAAQVKNATGMAFISFNLHHSPLSSLPPCICSLIFSFSCIAPSFS